MARVFQQNNLHFELPKTGFSTVTFLCHPGASTLHWLSQSAQLTLERSVSSFRHDTAELVWEIATLYPPQGAWSDEGYLSFTNSTNRLIEFTDGRVEFLPMPTKSHQLILMYLLESISRRRL